MQHDAKKLLYDVLRASEDIGQFIAGKDYADFLNDPLLQAGVERKFEILGEAVSKLGRVEPDVAGRLPERARIVGFRNVLIHAYEGVDPAIVWDIARNKLPLLRAARTSLLT